MNYNISVKELMRKRRSVRTYSKQKVEQNKKDIIIKEMEILKDERFRFVIIDFNFEEGMKLGTYGMIKGASTYMIGIIDRSLADDKQVALDFGYAFEKLVLKATELDLGTCWMASTFNISNLNSVLTLGDNEHIVMVSPLGYEEKIRGKEKLTRFIIKADKRKQWKDLFFNQNFSTPLSKEEAGEYAEVLDMVRIGPSAKNLQPWRIKKTAESFDIFTAKTAYSEKEGQKINITYNDIGIALAHFELTVKEEGLSGHWVINTNNNHHEENYKYVCSWKFKE